MTFRVATFNALNGQIHRGKRRHFLKGPIRVPELVDDVARFEADIVGLQEIDRLTFRTLFRDAPRLLSRRLGSEVIYRASRRHWVLGQFGNALVSREPVRDPKLLRLRRLHWSEQKRTALFGTFDVGQVLIRVATTHLSSRRDESELQLQEIFDEMNASVASGTVGPAIIFGDMNLRPHEAIPKFESRGWSVVETGPTYPSWEPKLRIDYIAIKGLRVVRAEARRCTVSDHLAVVADLEVLAKG